MTEHLYTWTERERQLARALKLATRLAGLTGSEFYGNLVREIESHLASRRPDEELRAWARDLPSLPGYVPPQARSWSQRPDADDILLEELVDRLGGALLTLRTRGYRR
ncbi:MAG: hypothetical protein QM621_02540 [Aeromicrobium sp.]|uniref:hypothetical protein n=1 Tax=Aeromicrobium sp. TaxID=1871063 RepID=UPI0039E341B8